MIPLLLIFAFIGLERLVVSERWPALNPVRTLWHLWMPRIKEFLRTAPATFTYLFILVITTWVLQTSSSKIAEQLLLERSTNLHQLVRDPIRVLFGSAFWVANTGELLFSILAFALIASHVERWIGTARTITVFFVGHVGATLLVAFWIWNSTNFLVVKTPLSSARDVGSSYGLAALAAIFTFRIHIPRRWVYLATAIAVVSVPLIFSSTFTNWGHAFALLLGYSTYFFIPKKVRNYT